MSVHTGLLTVEEFQNLAVPKEGHIELHHGEVTFLPPAKRGHQRIQRRILALLTGLAGKEGVVETEMAFRPAPEHEVWMADVGYIKLDRDQATADDEYLTDSPNLVVEVLSPMEHPVVGDGRQTDEAFLAVGYNLVQRVPRRDSGRRHL